MRRCVSVVAEDGSLGPCWNGAEGEENVARHPFVLEATKVGGFVLEKTREASEGETPWSGNRDHHFGAAVHHAARLVANLVADFGAAARANGRSKDNDLEILALPFCAGGLQTLLEEGQKIVRVVARSVLENKRGIA